MGFSILFLVLAITYRECNRNKKNPDAIHLGQSETLGFYFPELASLIEGVYSIDRHSLRYPEYSKYWMSLGYTLCNPKDFVYPRLPRDGHEHIFQVYENFSNHQNPKFVVAFRGTMKRFQQDLADDVRIPLGTLLKNPRYRYARDVIEYLVETYGGDSVAVTGHSLGASAALCICRELFLDGVEVWPPYLFNLPYVDIDRMAGVARISSSERDTENFKRLKNWAPVLYLNKQDPFCSSLINVFRHPHARSPTRTQIKYLIPSAKLVVDEHHEMLSPFEAHAIRHWIHHDQDLFVEYHTLL